MSTHSRHAEIRMQQRGIDPLIVKWTILYGAKKYDRRGAVKHYFDRKSRRNLARAVGGKVVDLLAPLLNTVVVESVDRSTVITVTHRTKRV